ncbi:helix-turn-helix domain-containing protein [Natronobeatus ordinarius]|uniref:helix-turn-helix domain-containing protein n=1 Tax=Natronobeatus ordinarius TaxID=2963433 RepID=UPI0020CCA0D7|nr:helix-turn-helix domain-containing protein [Natronobeatus ordinarius]
MSTIAELTLPAEGFALRRTLEAAPDVEVEVERVVAYEPDQVMPYVWFSGSESALTALDDALAEDQSVENAELLTDLDDERLYRMQWVADVSVIVHVLTEEMATILDASGERRQWRLRILFPEREALSRTYEFATDQGLSLSIQKIHELDEQRGGRYGLTDTQHETLVKALEGGYYAIPREVDMESLSDDLGISHQALSERLRRAHRALVEEAVSIGPQEEFETDDH